MRRPPDVSTERPTTGYPGLHLRAVLVDQAPGCPYLGDGVVRVYAHASTAP